LKCPGNCGRIYLLSSKDVPSTIAAHDELDVMLLMAAYENKSKKISKGKN